MNTRIGHPDGVGISFGVGFYKYIAPLALGISSEKFRCGDTSGIPHPVLPPCPVVESTFFLTEQTVAPERLGENSCEVFQHLQVQITLPR